MRPTLYRQQKLWRWLVIDHADYLVVGTGLAGLAYALKVADSGKVLILSKESAPDTNTAMAQGGIATVLGADDSFEQHVSDTIEAGAGLCHSDVVQMVVESAPNRIEDLVRWGVNFDGPKATPDLTREGGHSRRRILHIQDHTGQVIHKQLLAKVKAHKNIELQENVLGIDLILNREFDPTSTRPVVCLGLHVFDRNRGVKRSIFARQTVLATGGAGKVYLYTSNWHAATGDGIAMAFRAGAQVANMEFTQFHPTCLFHPKARNFLITEAIRGEGGLLLDNNHEPFAKKYHPLGELAPRDIVARSIDAEMKKSGAPCVFLDISHKSKDFILDRFPVIYRTCLEHGIDMTKEPIPVVPAAHYLCGGVLTDRNGQTDIPGLFAIGETACTGLHGANRLASNSLLECLVFANTAAEWSKAHLADFPLQKFESDPRSVGSSQTEDEMIVIAHTWEEIRRLMWNYVGIVRSDRRLLRAWSRLQTISKELEEYAHPIHSDIIELLNIALVARLTVASAMRRKESRGIHFNIDHPATLASEARDTIFRRGSIFGDQRV